METQAAHRTNSGRESPNHRGAASLDARKPAERYPWLMTGGPILKQDFWEQPDLVERFAAREPDVRLMELLPRYDDPARVRVLDLGCAGGRNTVPLAELGFDVSAIDSSRAMVDQTRRRLDPVLGATEAVARVLEGRMEDLGRFADAYFGLVVGLGVYHQASSPQAWTRAISETRRVLEPGGLLLYASFHQDTAPGGATGHPVAGQRNMYSGFRSGSVFLVGPDELERRLRALDLVPHTPTATVRVQTKKGVRVTVNGLFRRLGADPKGLPAGTL